MANEQEEKTCLCTYEERQVFPCMQTANEMLNNFSKQHFCFEIIQYEQTLNTHTSDGTTNKLSNTQGKNKTTVLVGVCVRSQLRSRTVYGTLH